MGLENNNNDDDDVNFVVILMSREIFSIVIINNIIFMIMKCTHFDNGNNHQIYARIFEGKIVYVKQHFLRRVGTAITQYSIQQRADLYLCGMQIFFLTRGLSTGYPKKLKRTLLGESSSLLCF